MEDHFNEIAASCHCFINRVVNGLIYEMVQTMYVGRTDVHPRSMAYMFNTTEGTNILSFLLSLHGCLSCHKVLLDRSYNNSTNPFIIPYQGRSRKNICSIYLAVSDGFWGTKKRQWNG